MRPSKACVICGGPRPPKLRGRWFGKLANLCQRCLRARVILRFKVNKGAASSDGVASPPT